MNVIIRQEQNSDHQLVEKVVDMAFRNMDFSDQTEHLLVARLRKSNTFIPELSLVAEIAGQIVGHILFTKIRIIDGHKKTISLSLAPISVLPEFQRKGIGGKLIIRSHEIARSMGFKSVILVGHEDYYPKFGYTLLSNYEIQLPFDAPDQNCMCIELVKGSLSGISGKVEFPKEFF